MSVAGACQAAVVAYQTPLTVKETLDRVAQGRLVLPAIQREFVWVSDLERITRMFDSLLRQYPIGTFLFWDVASAQSREFVRLASPSPSGQGRCSACPATPGPARPLQRAAA